MTPPDPLQYAEYVAPDECSHSWRTCPVHSTGTDEMPSFATVVTCIYGGAELKDGGTWNEGTSKEVLARMWARIGGDDYGPGPGDVDDSPAYHALRQFDGTSE